MVKIFYDLEESNESKKKWLPSPFADYVLGSKIPYPFPAGTEVELIHPASALPGVSFGVVIRVADENSGARGASGALTSYQRGRRNVMVSYVTDEEGYPSFISVYENQEMTKDLLEAQEELSDAIYHAFIVLEMFKVFRPEVLTEKTAYSETKKRKVNVSKNDYVLHLDAQTIRYIHEKKAEVEKEHEKRTNRYHMARGHYRHYANGKVVWIKAHYKGDKSKGVINKDYMLTAH